MYTYMHCNVCDKDVPIQESRLTIEASTHLQVYHNYHSRSVIPILRSALPDDIYNLQVAINDTARAKGWWDNERSAGEILMNIAAEVSEAWEEWRKRGYGEPLYYENDVRYHLIENPENDSESEVEYLITPAKPEGLVVELADTIIRILDFCEAYEWDVVDALQRKMEYNETRSYRHGGKLA